MVTREDWRWLNQERWLQGLTLQLQRWYCPRPEWDHDHCEFCWAKFMEENYPGVLHFGYTTADGKNWICEQCFEDFKDQFQWKVN